MDVTCQSYTLHRSLKHILGAIGSTKDLQPILRNVLLTAEGSTLVLRGSDMHLQAALPVPLADIKAPGAITVPARLLFNALGKSLRENLTHLSIEGGRLVIRNGRTVYKLNSEPADAYPVWPPLVEPVRFNLSAALVRHLFRQTRFAASTDHQRPQLRGVRLHRSESGDALIAVTTTGNMLAWVTTPTPPGAEQLPAVTIPDDVVDYMLRFIDTDHPLDGDISCAISDKQAEFINTDFGLRITTQLINQDFPNYHRIIPSPDSHKLQVLVARDALLDALGRLSVVLRDDIMRAKLTISEATMTIEASGHSELKQSGTATEELDCVCTTPGGIELYLSPKVLSAILSHMDSPGVAMRFADPMAPIILAGGEGKHGSLYLMMPMAYVQTKQI